MRAAPSRALSKPLTRLGALVMRRRTSESHRRCSADARIARANGLEAEARDVHLAGRAGLHIRAKESWGRADRRSAAPSRRGSRAPGPVLTWTSKYSGAASGGEPALKANACGVAAARGSQRRAFRAPLGGDVGPSNDDRRALRGGGRDPEQEKTCQISSKLPSASGHRVRAPSFFSP